MDRKMILPLLRKDKRRKMKKKKTNEQKRAK